MVFKDGTFIPSDEGMEIVHKNSIDLNDAISRKDVIALFEDEQVKKEVPKFCELMIEIINMLPSLTEKEMRRMLNEELQRFDYPPKI